MASAAFRDAVVKYRLQFPTLADLGTGTPPSAWAAELAKVSPGAFDQVKALAMNFEGGAMSGVGNFEQMHLVRALCARRAELDVTFANPYLDEPIGEPFVRIGSVVRMHGHPCCPPPAS